MANDFDQFPLYDPLVKTNGNKLSDIWVSSMSTFYQNLLGYLSARGIFIPVLTTAQRNAITNPQEGQMIYNKDATPAVPGPRSAEIQVWQVKANVGAWRTVTTVP